MNRPLINRPGISRLALRIRPGESLYFGRNLRCIVSKIRCMACGREAPADVKRTVQCTIEASPDIPVHRSNYLTKHEIPPRTLPLIGITDGLADGSAVSHGRDEIVTWETVLANGGKLSGPHSCYIQLRTLPTSYLHFVMSTRERVASWHLKDAAGSNLLDLPLRVRALRWKQVTALREALEHDYSLSPSSESLSVSA